MSLFGTLEGRLEHLLHLGETHDSMAKSIQADVANAKTDIQDRLEVFKEEILSSVEAQLASFVSSILGVTEPAPAATATTTTTVTATQTAPAPVTAAATSPATP